MKKFNIFLIFASLLIIFACDEVDEPYLEIQGTGGGGGDSNSVQKHVLIEEFTGHKCKNCPYAHEIVKTLKQIYGERLVVISVHASEYYAGPDDDPPYTYDFRTAVGNELYSDFGQNAAPLPSAMINRTEFEGVLVNPNRESWQGIIEPIMSEAPVISIEITSPSLNAGTLSADFDVEILSGLSGNYYLTAYITEDSIIKPQTMPNNSDSLTYEHDHVLRGSMNGTWGQLLTQETDLPEGSVYPLSVSSEFDDEWVPENCHIAAFVYNGESNEVIGAREAKVVPGQ